MKPERAFIAHGVAAQHCGELLRGAPASRDVGPALARALPHLEAELARMLTAMTGGDRPSVTCEPPREASHAVFASELPGFAAISAMRAGAGAPLLAVIDAAAVFAFVDRAFGGAGNSPDPLPDAFPVSAELMLARLESAIATALGRALTGGEGGVIRPAARGSRLALVSPLDDAEGLTLIRLTVIEDSFDPWRLTLALTGAALGALLADDAGSAAKPERPANPDPLAGPFGDMPLTLTATLVDMRVPFATIARLRVGDVMPVAVARSVPVSVGGQIIAHGTIGECDDRVAVRLTHTFGKDHSS